MFLTNSSFPYSKNKLLPKKFAARLCNDFHSVASWQKNHTSWRACLAYVYYDFRHLIDNELVNTAYHSLSSKMPK